MRTSSSILLKSTINLAQKDKRIQKPRPRTLLILAALLLTALFVRTRVADPLLLAARIEARAEQQEALLLKTYASLSDFSLVQDTYEIEKQTQIRLSGRADVMDSLSLIEAELLLRSRVQSFTIAANQITVRLSDVTLHEMSAIYQHLMASRFVENVQLYTASTGESATNRATATMTVSLVSPKNETPPATKSEEGAAS